MGLQVDLTEMLNVPLKHQCPKCKAVIDTRFDDFDLEGGCYCINNIKGLWEFNHYCHECEHEWTRQYQVNLIPVPTPTVNPPV